jgi:hypothetical protein
MALSSDFQVISDLARSASDVVGVLCASRTVTEPRFAVWRNLGVGHFDMHLLSAVAEHYDADDQRVLSSRVHKELTLTKAFCRF